MTYQGQQDYASSAITGVPAVEYARGLSITGISGGLDIPNLYELCVLYIEGDYIDTLDPTIGDNPTKALGKFTNSYRWFNNGYCWSSTESSPPYQRGVVYYGGVSGYDKYGSGSVIPTRELA